MKPGEDANVKMEQHIAGGCAKPAKTAVFTHRCSYGKCKKKELVQCICKGCGLNHCIKHRQPDSHRCGLAKKPPARGPAGPPATAPAAQQKSLTASLSARRVDERPPSAAAQAAERRAQAATAAMTRQQHRSATPAPAVLPSTSGTLPPATEDDELQRALALSMQTAEPTHTVEDLGALGPLVAMGYPPEAAAEAMAASGGDLQRAALLLMENASAADAASAQSGGVRATA